MSGMVSAERFAADTDGDVVVADRAARTGRRRIAPRNAGTARGFLIGIASFATTVLAIVAHRAAAGGTTLI